MKLSINTHSFNVDLAKEIGIQGAILLQHFHYWTENNRDKKNYIKDGRIWTYNSQAGLVSIFPYLTVRQIRHQLEFLINEGFLMTGNYNKKKYDKTIWYSLTEKSLELFNCNPPTNLQNPPTKTADASDENVGAIPNIKSNIKKDTLSTIEKETQFNSPERSSALFQLDSKHNWENILSLWITEESSSVLNAVYKKHFLNMDRDKQDGIVQFIKSLGSDLQFMRNIWISSFLKNGSDLDSLKKDIERKKQFNKNNPIQKNLDIATREELNKSADGAIDMNKYF